MTLKDYLINTFSDAKVHVYLDNDPIDTDNLKDYLNYEIFDAIDQDDGSVDIHLNHFLEPEAEKLDNLESTTPEEVEQKLKNYEKWKRMKSYVAYYNIISNMEGIISFFLCCAVSFLGLGILSIAGISLARIIYWFYGLLF